MENYQKWANLAIMIKDQINHPMIQKDCQSLIDFCSERINENVIDISWNVVDVEHAANELSLDLNLKQCKIILQEIKDGHEASIGINWDIITIRIKEYLESIKF